MGPFQTAYLRFEILAASITPVLKVRNSLRHHGPLALFEIAAFFLGSFKPHICVLKIVVASRALTFIFSAASAWEMLIPPIGGIDWARRPASDKPKPNPNAEHSPDHNQRVGNAARGHPTASDQEGDKPDAIDLHRQAEISHRPRKNDHRHAQAEEAAPVFPILSAIVERERGRDRCGDDEDHPGRLREPEQVRSHNRNG